MRVDVRQEQRTFHYTVSLDDDDRAAGGRPFAEGARVALGGRRGYEVRLEAPFADLHPDLHAAAVWRVVHPFVGRRLRLPFGVSAAFAGSLNDLFGLDVGPVDGALAPRATPATPRPGLLFSGGLDSTACHLFLPDSAVLLFLDRLPLPPTRPDTQELIEPVQQRRLAERLRADGRTVAFQTDDHEGLYHPYPAPHTAQTFLPALYYADAFDLSHVETGVVLGNYYLDGYGGPGTRSWRFRPLPADGWPTPDMRAHAQHLAVLGLRVGRSLAGASEVATALAVHRSSLRGQTYSCFQRSFHSHCMTCDKCFRKLLLQHVFEDREVPPALPRHFLSVPRLAELFAAPYLGFHHVWLYALQRVRCAHPFVAELATAARAAPDVGFLERWYPGADAGVPAPYRAAVTAHVARWLETMSAADVAAFEALDLPPLRPARGGGGG